MQARLRKLSCGLALCCVLTAVADAEPLALNHILRPEEHTLVSMSPDGRYIAATLRMEQNHENRVVLVIIDRATLKPVRVLDPEEKAEISNIWWINDHRVYVQSAWGGNSFQQYYTDPRIVAIDVDGSHRKIMNVTVLDTLAKDPDNILIIRCGKTTSKGCMTFVEKRAQDLRGSGDRIVDAPDLDVAYQTDNSGHVIFASNEDDDHVQKVWIRRDDTWVLFNDSSSSKVKVWMIGTSRDDSAAFLLAEREKGPDVIERYDFATGERSVVMSDPALDPLSIRWSADGLQPIGAAYGLGVSRARFWDPDDPDAKLLRAIEAAFPDDVVSFLQGSMDGKHVLVSVAGDRDPGSYYLLDRDTKHLDLLLRRKSWLDPSVLASAEPIMFAASDGVELNGYLTRPLGVPGNVPLVVLPHGGPFDVRDQWEYDEDVQILAAHGFAVLRVNFRGSSGRGRDFVESGYRQWGYRVMDDIFDGTRWAMQQPGIDPKRVCIWGSSFGGYAALMGAAKAPALYRCAISTSGPTNLEITRKWGDIHRSKWGRHFLDTAVGSDTAKLFDQSPLKYVDDIQVPILLVHGEHDQRVSFEHAKAFADAMMRAKKPLETMFFPDETHGIFGEKNRQSYYTRVLQFLDAHIGADGVSAGTD